MNASAIVACPAMTEVRKVLFFSPAGQEPKAYISSKIEGKPVLSKQNSSCVWFSIGDKAFIADKASWRTRKENGYIYVLEL